MLHVGHVTIIYAVMLEEASKACYYSGASSGAPLFGACHLLSCITSVTVWWIYVYDYLQ